MSRAFVSGQEGGGPFKTYEIDAPTCYNELNVEAETLLGYGLPPGDYLLRYMYYNDGTMTTDVMVYVQLNAFGFSSVQGGPSKRNGSNYSAVTCSYNSQRFWLSGISETGSQKAGYAIAL